MSYIFDENKKEIDLFISAHSKNKFIILLDGIESRYATGIINSGDSLDLPMVKETHSDKFWSTNNINLMHNSKINQLFIKIVDSCDKGLHIKLQNIRPY